MRHPGRLRNDPYIPPPASFQDVGGLPSHILRRDGEGIALPLKRLNALTSAGPPSRRTPGRRGPPFPRNARPYGLKRAALQTENIPRKKACQKEQVRIWTLIPIMHWGIFWSLRQNAHAQHRFFQAGKRNAPQRGVRPFVLCCVFDQKPKGTTLRTAAH